ncbi:MAG: glycolate oxidase subunit GlcE [Gammaproteobacteria bacterium]|nr:glycolate oxidase subunit GlcE [Gammaproteobacteria bacterium]
MSGAGFDGGPEVEFDAAGDAAGAVLAQLSDRIRAATRDRLPLRIAGGDTRSAVLRPVPGQLLRLAAYRGILAYSPSELVITARAGTPLAEIESALAARGQMLGFEPPRFGAASTIGGVVATGLAGPRRPYAGAVRDFVLGVRVMNGRGEVLRFGGQVMKNVAGYDVSRLMAGAHGTLGVIVDVSLRVLPRPAGECSVLWQLAPDEALQRMTALARRPLAIAGLAYAEGVLRARLAGQSAAVDALIEVLAPDAVEPGLDFWEALRDLPTRTPREGQALWRFAVSPAAPPIDLPGSWTIDWGGAQRWLETDVDDVRMHAAAAHAGGHAARLRGVGGASLPPLPPALLALHRALKQAFDPAGVFNPGRLYDGL